VCHRIIVSTSLFIYWIVHFIFINRQHPSLIELSAPKIVKNSYFDPSYVPTAEPSALWFKYWISNAHILPAKETSANKFYSTDRPKDIKSLWKPEHILKQKRKSIPELPPIMSLTNAAEFRCNLACLLSGGQDPPIQIYKKENAK
jgi:hypothetical protein